MKTLLSLLLIFLFVNVNATSYTVSISMKGFVNQPAYIAKVSGDMSFYVDTIISDIAGNVKTTFDDNTSTGMYTFVFPKLRNAEVAFIFNKENITLQTDITSPQTFVQVISSKENDIYYHFLKDRKDLQNNIEILEYTYGNYTGKNYLELTKKEYSQLINNYNVSFQNLEKISRNMFVNRVIKSLKPVLANELLSPSQKNIYLQNHFFDNIDFSDSLLFATNIFTDGCVQYLKTFSTQYQNTKSNAIFKNAVDTIMIKTIMYPATYDFVTDYLLTGFESMGAQEIVQYISEKYLEQKTCKNDTKTTLQHKVLSNTELAIGKSIPKFTLKNDKGTISSVDISYEPTVIVYWASWCGHCTEMIPKILKDYESKKNKFMLITVSLDSDTEDWKEFMKTQPGFGNTINFCDEKSWDGEAAQAFHVYATPTIFIIKNGVIVGKPIDYEGFNKQLTKLGL